MTAHFEAPDLRDKAWHVDLWYPRIEDDRKPDAVTIGLMDVRAADTITVRYDFDRDGWTITQDLTREREGGGSMEVVSPDVEVAFVPAWNEQMEGTT